MTEKYPGDPGRGIYTWYRLTRDEILSLIDRQIIPLEPGKRRSDVQDGEIRADLGQEAAMDALIVSWGFTLTPVNKC